MITLYSIKYYDLVHRVRQFSQTKLLQKNCSAIAVTEVILYHKNEMEFEIEKKLFVKNQLKKQLLNS